MKKIIATLFLTCFVFIISKAQLPEGFIDELFTSDVETPTGLTFDNNGKMYVWEKRGRVFVFENNTKTLLIDIGQEVLNYTDHGLNGFALDPNFLNNGYIYLMYVANRCYVLGEDCNSYPFKTTIARITRYTANFDSNGFPNIDYNSRLVLVGETISTGIPILVDNHGIGSLVFGTDGSLLASTGDAAVADPMADEGANSWFQEAVAVGIVDNSQLVNSYRSQALNSLNGKILRIDPATGDGISSNPFFDSNNIRSAQSRIWTYGMRNPFRFTIKPGTGSTNQADGNPGTLYAGDVGWINREEIDIIDGGGKNGGWPRYEGNSHENVNFTNPNYDFSNHLKPIIEWRGAVAKALINDNIYDIGTPHFTGNNFTGIASIGGVFYTGTNFPLEYQNMYIQGDYSGWIKGFHFDIDIDHQEIAVKNFTENVFATCFAVNPIDGAIYYTNYHYETPNPIQEVRKISYNPNANFSPIAFITVSPNYGVSPLAVQFDGSQSYDPENGVLTYQWDFGDGSLVSNQINPEHIYTTATTTPTFFTATLTVTDPLDKSTSSSVYISLNNTPPVINSTSVDNTNCFLNTNSLLLSLDAQIIDNEHSANDLIYKWSLALHHEDHTHLQNVINTLQGQVTLEPVPSDGQLYYYELTLKVEDGAKLSTLYTKYIYPLQQSYNLVDPTNHIQVNANRLYFAQETILGANTIDGKVEYRAGSSIILNAGFKAEAGSVFKAQIQGCNNN